MAGSKLIKKDVRQMAQDAIIAGMAFQYKAITIAQIANDVGIDLDDAQRIHDEMRVQMHRCAVLFGFPESTLDDMLDIPLEEE